MKMCESCRYRNNTEYEKPCIVYRDDCEFYEKERGDMTREEAIKNLSFVLSALDENSQIAEVYRMAIKALEQEPCGDAVSRQAVLDGIDTYIYKAQSTGTQDDFYSFAELVVKQLPSVNPQEPKTGHWIEKDGFDGDVYYDCSECGESWTTIEGTPWQNGMAYCPNCGARM